MGSLLSKQTASTDHDISEPDDNDETMMVHRMMDEQDRESDAETASEPAACCVSFRRRAMAVNAFFRHNITDDVNQFLAQAASEVVPMPARDTQRINAWVDDVIAQVDTTLDCPVQMYAKEQEARRALRIIKRRPENQRTGGAAAYSVNDAMSAERSSQAATSVGLDHAIAQYRAAKQLQNDRQQAVTGKPPTGSGSHSVSAVFAGSRSNNMGRSVTSTFSDTRRASRRNEGVGSLTSNVRPTAAPTAGSEGSDGSVHLTGSTNTNSAVGRFSADNVLSRAYHLSQRRAHRVAAVRNAKYGPPVGTARSRRSAGSRFSFTDSEDDGSDVATAEDIREHAVRAATPLEQTPTSRPVVSLHSDGSFSGLDLTQGNMHPRTQRHLHHHHHGHHRPAAAVVVMM